MALPNPRNPLEEWDLKFAASAQKDHVFYIHKSVVSRVGWFGSYGDPRTPQPAKDTTIPSLHHTDRDTISRMLWYLYFGHYSYTTLYPFVIEGLPKSQQPFRALESDGDDEDIRSGRRSFVDVLLIHMRMYFAGKHYIIPNLMKLAQDKVVALLNTTPQPDALLFKDPRDFRDVKTLMEDMVFPYLYESELGESLEWRLFLTNVLGHAVDNLGTAQKKIEQLEARLQEMEAKEKGRNAKVKKDEESDEVIESRKKIEELEKKLKELELGSSVGEGWEELQMED